MFSSQLLYNYRINVIYITAHLISMMSHIFCVRFFRPSALNLQKNIMQDTQYKTN